MLHNRYLHPGGEDQSTAAEVALLRGHGEDVELIELDNREIETSGKVRTALQTLWSSASFQRVRQRLRERRCDILHVQNFFPLWSPSVYYAAADCHVPVVQTLHNYRLLCVNSLLYRDNHVCEDCLRKAVPGPGILHGCYRQSRAGSTVVAGMIGLHKLLRTWKRRVHVYVAVSEFAREKYIAGGLPADKIAVRRNFLHPAPPPGPGGGGYALFVGRLSPEKGIATMLAAWKAAEHPLPLKIVGDGPLRQLVMAACQSTASIEYLGSKPLSEVLLWMGGAELLVFPSEWYETMGRTVMEGLAVGTPVLASNLGAHGSMVVPGKTGFHFAPGDVDSLRQQVEFCSANLGLLQSLRKNARAAFEATYTGAAALESLLAIYDKARQAQA